MTMPGSESRAKMLGTWKLNVSQPGSSNVKLNALPRSPLSSGARRIFSFALRWLSRSPRLPSAAMSATFFFASVPVKWTR